MKQTVFTIGAQAFSYSGWCPRHLWVCGNQSHHIFYGTGRTAGEVCGEEAFISEWDSHRLSTG